MESAELQEFLTVLRSGDEPAIEELLRNLDPYLRRVIRLRLVDGRLRHVLDTTDIFHSLLEDFLARKADRPVANDARGGLHAYLAAAVHHKIRTKLRKEQRHGGSLPPDREPVDPAPAVSDAIESRDLLAAIRARLPAEKRLLLDLKAQGLDWYKVSEHVGGSPDTLRMRLRRAIAVALGDLNRQEAGRAH